MCSHVIYLVNRICRGDEHFLLQKFICEMTRETILDHVKNLIIKISPDTPKDNIFNDDRLTDYIHPNDRFSFGERISNKFSRVSTSEVQRKLFESLKTVGKLVDFILEHYQKDENGVIAS